MENTIRIGKESKGKGLFGAIEKRLALGSLFEDGFPVQYLPKFMFVLLLALLYISNTHYAEKTLRKIDRTEVEVEDLRANYTTLKSELMVAGKQSEVAKRIKTMGLVESSNPPGKIVAKE